MAFDAAKAREAGYSDSEITDFLAKETDFKADDARKAGYSDEEIATHLIDQQKESEKPLNRIGKLASDGLDAIKGGINKAAVGLNNASTSFAKQAGAKKLPDATGIPLPLTGDAKAVSDVPDPRESQIAPAVKQATEAALAGAEPAVRDRAMAQAEIDASTALSKQKDFRQQYAADNPLKAGVISGTAGIQQGLLDVIPLAADTINAVINPYIQALGGDGFAPAPRIQGSTYLQDMAKGYKPEIANKRWSNLKGFDETTDWLAAQAAIQSPQMVAGVGAAVLPKVRALYLGTMGAMSAGGQYTENKEAGLEHSAAVADAWVNGGIEVLSEMLPLHVFDKLKAYIPRLNLAQRAGLVGTVLERSGVAAAAMAGQTIPEGASEVAAQIGQNASNKYIGGNDSIKDVTDGWQDAGIIGMLMGTPTAVTHAGSVIQQGRALDKARGSINRTLNTDTHQRLDDDELGRLQSVAAAVNTAVPNAVDLPKIEAEIQRRESLGTLTRAAETSEREKDRFIEEAATTPAPSEALDAADLLGVPNVSEPNNDAGLDTEAIAPGADNTEGSGVDLLPGAGGESVYAGQPGDATELGQGDANDILSRTGLPGGDAVAEVPPIADEPIDRAKREAGENVDVIRLNAPVDKLLEEVKQFPSATTATESEVPQDNSASRARPSLPESVSSGLIYFKPKGINKVLYRETNAQGLDSIINGSYTNSFGRGDVITTYVADNPDLAIGQGENAGFKIQFRPNALSGDENVKPGTNDLTGREYKTNFIGLDAVNQILMDKRQPLRGLTKNLILQNFDVRKLEGGKILYTRKGVDVGETLDSIYGVKNAESEQQSAATKSAQKVSQENPSVTFSAENISPQLATTRIIPAKESAPADQVVGVNDIIKPGPVQVARIGSKNSGETISLRAAGDKLEVLYNGDPLIDYETENEVSVPVGASLADIKAAVKSSGQFNKQILTFDKDYAPPVASQTAPSKTVEVSNPVKAEVKPKTTREKLDERFTANQDVLRAWMPDMDWATIGGRMIRDSEDNVQRTTWQAKDPNFDAIRSSVGISFPSMRNAVQKALDGKPLSKLETSAVNALVDFAEISKGPAVEDIAASENLTVEEEYALAQMAADIDWQKLMASVAADDNALASISARAQTYKSQFDQEAGEYLEQITEYERQDQSNNGQADARKPGESDEGSGQPGERARGGNAEGEEQAQDSGNAASKDLLGQDTSGAQAVADAERAKDTKRNAGDDNSEDFTLTGSNSEADKAAARGARPLFSRSDQTETPNFSKWFGDSKVVDADGKPLVVYHGTTADFESFDNSKTGANDRGLWGKGHYFAASAETASSYAIRQGEGAQVMPSYVSIKNPLVLKTGPDLVTRLPDGANVRDIIGQNLDGAKVKQIAFSGGHDGVIQIRPNGLIGDVVAFNPEQIKSAVGNNGEFNPEDPRINFSRAGTSGGLSKQDTQSIVDQITAGWAHAPQIIVVEDMSDPSIRKAVREENDRQLSQGATGQPEGFFDAGKVYILSSEMNSPNDVARVLMHETLGHYGLRGTFGKALRPVLQNVALMRNKEVAAKAREYGLKLDVMEDRLIAAEEVLAEMAQANPDLPLVKRAIAAIRTWLRDNVPYFKNIELTDDEIIRNILEPARNFVRNGKKDKAAAGMVTAFSRTNRKPSRDSGDTMLTAALEYLARDPELFQRPLTESKSIYDIAKELDPGYRVTQLGKTMTADRKANRAWEVFVPGSDIRSGIIMTKENEVWIDVSRLQSGQDSGSAIYDMAAAFAHNNGKVLIGDPEGLTRKALYRRNENMLSSALKYGTTKHLKPHLAQEIPSEYYTGHDAPWGKKQRALKWIEGDDVNNIKELVYNSWSSAMDNMPELKDVIYNPDSQEFEYVDGRPFTSKDSERIAAGLAGQPNNPYRAGSSTQKRASLFNTFLRSESGEGRRQVLGKLVTQLSRDGLAPALKRVMYSRSKPPSDSLLSNNWNSPEVSKFSSLVYTLQDKLIDLKDVTKAIKSAGNFIEDRWNAYLQEELYHGRTAKRTADFLKDELEPLIADMRMRGVKMADFEEYLWARHAPERNAQIAKVNDDLPDGGSGLTDAEAQEYMDSLKPGAKSNYEALAKRVDAINQKSRQVLVDYALESQDTINTWAATYKHYVPLMREDMDRGFGNGTGQGYSVKGNAAKRATGSKRPVVDILANIAQQRERNIIRGEKNRVATALVGLSKINPNPKFWKTDTPPMLKTIGKDGKVEDRVDPNYKNRDNVVVARIGNRDGKVTEHSVIFNEHDERAMRLAASIKNLDADQIGYAMGLVGSVTRYFAAINTQYNPIFGLVNILRDVQGSLLNLSTTPLAGKQKEVLGHTLPALRGIYKEMRSDRKGKSANSEWSGLWEEFQREGGQTGYRDQFRNSKERGDAILKALDPQWWQDTKLGKVVTAGGLLNTPEKLLQEKAVKLVFEWLSDYNEAMENAVRLSTYKVALDNGISKQKAASLAKNISVNFNRKGQAGRQINALYAFFNASVQGTARIAETLNGPAGKNIIIGGLLLGTMQALALAMAGFDDEEPPEFVRDRNIIIPIGGKKYLTIPMPLGFNAIPNMGRILTEWALAGGEDSGKRVVHIFSMLMDVMNPIGGSGNPANIVMPTVGDPLVDLARNKDFAGREIAREDFNSLDPTPGFTRAKDTSSAISKALAKGINYITGGTDYKPGALSPSPDTIDYLIGQVTGGVGREAMKIEQFARTTITGEDLPTYKIPIAGKFYGDAESKSSQSAAFYNNLRMMNEHENEIKGRSSNKGDVEGYRKENPETTLIGQANLAERQVSKLRKRKRMLAEAGDKEGVLKVEDRINVIMTGLNQKIRSRKDAESP